MRARLMLFDIDGTLIDTDGAGRVAMERASRDVLGTAPPLDPRTSGVRFAGMTDPVIMKAVSRAMGVEDRRYESHREELTRRFLLELGVEMQRSGSRRRVLPGVRALLAALRARAEVHLGLLTGNLEEGARIKLEAFGLNPYFPAGGFSSDHPDRREIARIAWRRLSDRVGFEFAAESVTVIGDTEHDVDCARANGFRAVAVDSGWVPRDRLERAGPDVLLDDLGDTDAALAALGV